MNPITLATGHWGPGLSVSMCGALTRQQAQRLIKPIALSLADKHDHPMVSAVRGNMAIISGRSLHDPEVDRAVVRLLGNTLAGYADLFRLVAKDHNPAILFDISNAAYQALEAHAKRNRGLVLVGVHMCSFDLSLLVAAGMFPAIQGLTKANPEGSAPIMNEIRSSYGIQATPLSTDTLRRTINLLQSGGVVAVAADVPVDDGEEFIFFGRRTRLGIGHARLALATGADMVVVVSHRTRGGRYRIEAVPILRPASTGNRREDALRLAQATLRRIERYIARWPDEWFMPIPVWPQHQPRYFL
jgi:lauroyl/myristoyl acyltransferase